MSKSMTRDEMLSFLSENPEFLAKGVTAESVLAKMEVAAYAAKKEEIVAAKRSETASISAADFLASVEEFVSSVHDFVSVTPADPKGGNKNTKVNRRHLEIPTEKGRLQIALYDYES